jgi:hypothetical protein
MVGSTYTNTVKRFVLISLLHTLVSLFLILLFSTTSYILTTSMNGRVLGFILRNNGGTNHHYRTFHPSTIQQQQNHITRSLSQFKIYTSASQDEVLSSSVVTPTDVKKPTRKITPFTRSSNNNNKFFPKSNTRSYTTTTTNSKNGVQNGYITNPWDTNYNNNNTGIASTTNSNYRPFSTSSFEDDDLDSAMENVFSSSSTSSSGPTRMRFNNDAPASQNPVRAFYRFFPVAGFQT